MIQSTIGFFLSFCDSHICHICMQHCFTMNFRMLIGNIWMEKKLTTFNSQSYRLRNPGRINPLTSGINHDTRNASVTEGMEKEYSRVNINSGVLHHIGKDLTPSPPHLHPNPGPWGCHINHPLPRNMLKVYQVLSSKSLEAKLFMLALLQGPL